MDINGELIPEEQQKFVWMVPYLNGVSLSATERNRLKEYLAVDPINLELPLQAFDWHSFIAAIKDFMGANFFPFMMLLAGGLSAFHYQKLLSVVGECTMLILSHLLVKIQIAVFLQNQESSYCHDITIL